MAGKFSVAIQGLKALDGLAEKIGNAANKDIHKAAIAGAVLIQEGIRQNIHDVTGHLSEGIEAGGLKRREGEPIAAYVRVNAKKAPHWHWLEYGNVRISPRPYFRVGYDERRAAAVALVAAGAKGGFSKVGR